MKEILENIVEPMAPAVVCIERRIKELGDTFTLNLKPADGDFYFRPGQFNMLYVFGVGEVPISISGDPENPQTLVHTIREVGGVTKALAGLKAGDSVGVRGPFGSSWPLEEAAGKDVVIVTGGIGLAPLRPAFYQILSQRDRFGRLALLYGARTPGDILFRKELEKWRAHFDLQVRVTVDSADETWFGSVGVVTTLIPKARFDPANTLVLICGPEIMMHFSVLEFKKLGVPVTNIYLSMERNMKCAVGFCGHCQYGPHFICKDGPVFRLDRIQPIFRIREI